MESKETAFNLEVVCHEPLEELVQHRQGVGHASIRCHGGGGDWILSESFQKIARVAKCKSFKTEGKKD